MLLLLTVCLCQVVGAASAKSTDRQCFKVLFSDKATVPFYVFEHEKAAKNKKHIFLTSPEVLLME